MYRFVELAALKSEYETEKMEWRSTASRQIELIAGLQSDVEMLSDYIQFAVILLKMFVHILKKEKLDKTFFKFFCFLLLCK